MPSSLCKHWYKNCFLTKKYKAMQRLSKEAIIASVLMQHHDATERGACTLPRCVQGLHYHDLAGRVPAMTYQHSWRSIFFI